MDVKAIGNRVVVIKDGELEEQDGGIIIPEVSQKSSQEAVVHAVGPGRKRNGKWRPTMVSVGDRVLVPRYGVFEVKHEGVEYTILPDDDIIAILGD